MIERDQSSGNDQCRMRELWVDGGIQRPERRHDGQHRTTGVVLDPLAEIGGGVFMTVIVSRRQDMVYLQSRGKRRENDEDHGHRDGESDSHHFVL